MLTPAEVAISRDGFVTLAAVFTPDEVAEMAASLDAAIAATPRDDPAILTSDGILYAARNVLAIWPPAASVWHRAALLEPLQAILGPRLGVVRVLFFDKPPGGSWALPWHKDLTIAVRDNGLPAARDLHPTRKAGVPHIEAPEAVLATMLTARIYLDPVDDTNGPLKVVPGSHRQGKALILEGAPVRTLHADTGDVLLIRPLVAHCSNRSTPGSTRHRRILHLELAGDPTLFDDLTWHDFVPASQEES
jgi:Phytanoyl-CoA dioxygenase (PhyH)